MKFSVTTLVRAAVIFACYRVGAASDERGEEPPEATSNQGFGSNGMVLIMKTCSKGCSEQQPEQNGKCMEDCKSCFSECSDIKKEAELCVSQCYEPSDNTGVSTLKLCREVCKQKRATAGKCTNKCKLNISSRSKNMPAFPFTSNLSFLNEDTAKGYSSIDDFKYDLEQAAWHFLNSVVRDNLSVPRCEVNVRGSAKRTSTLSTTLTADSLNDFGTNNQEKEVEEGDLVVSDGEVLYIAHGDKLIISNVQTGNITARVKMPSVKEMIALVDAASSPSYYPTPEIKRLLFHNNRLLVIVDGYEQVVSAKAGIEDEVIALSGSSHLRVYDTEELKKGNADALVTTDVTGSFRDIRSTCGSNVHVVTSSSVDTHSFLVHPYDRSEYPSCLMTEDEYISSVYNHAKDEAIPQFINNIVAALMVGKISLPDLVRLGHWLNDDQKQIASTSVNVMEHIEQIHSFDINGGTGKLDVSSAGAFLPLHYSTGDVYGSSSAVIIATANEHYNATYLMSFNVDGAKATPRAVGRIDGTVPNSHAIDVADSDESVLRVASTITGDSPTENYVINLKMQESGLMYELGRIKLGKENEQFTAVRFFDNIAYAVTFEIVDPLYVLNLTIPEEPFVIAELEVPGFSSYIQSMNDENTLLLTIGRKGEEDSVQASVFDVRDPMKPILSARLDIAESVDPGHGNKDYSHSSSDSLSDFKAIRYINGHLIVPIYAYSQDYSDGYDYYDDWHENDTSFDGFATYAVSEKAIETECKISLPDSGDSYDYYDYYDYYDTVLPARSMIFDGKIVTMKGDSVQSHDMSTCQEVWLIADVSSEEED